MRYFTTDTHFGHPLVTVLRGFTTFDPTHSRYKEVLRAHDRKTAEDWAKEETFGAGLTFRQVADTDAHDKAIVDHINTLVGPDDELWILGDIRFPHIADPSEELPASAQLQASAWCDRQP